MLARPEEIANSEGLSIAAHLFAIITAHQRGSLFSPPRTIADKLPMYCRYFADKR